MNVIPVANNHCYFFHSSTINLEHMDGKMRVRFLFYVKNTDVENRIKRNQKKKTFCFSSAFKDHNLELL